MELYPMFNMFTIGFKQILFIMYKKFPYDHAY